MKKIPPNNFNSPVCRVYAHLTDEERIDLACELLAKDMTRLAEKRELLKPKKEEGSQSDSRKRLGAMMKKKTGLHTLRFSDLKNAWNRNPFSKKKTDVILIENFLKGTSGSSGYTGVRLEPALNCYTASLSPFQPPAEIPKDHSLPSLKARATVVFGGSSRRCRSSAGSSRRKKGGLH